ncbi:hypothetical protein HYC85_026629 [Camellia sinensis]|uniref:Uncharacterized protein n=1 Tax=Camellia sinensis TaxID=4442 RepID=A0A7J7G451_CAMSI|nr:hypothetical protein HYC85_026629 [Camellia sinensis]
MATKLGFTLTAPRLFSARFRKPVALFSSNSPSSSSSSSRVRLVSLVDRQLCVRRRLFILSPKATTDQPVLLAGQVQEDEVVDSKILPYCSIDKKEKKSLGELEQEFLQALQAFYYEGRAIMSNEEFDNLKEELMWEGSSIVMLTSDEQKFLEASMAYVAGTPIMSDEEYDKLKMKLKMDGSDIVVEGPRCSLRSRKSVEQKMAVQTDIEVNQYTLKSCVETMTAVTNLSHRLQSRTNEVQQLNAQLALLQRMYKDARAEISVLKAENKELKRKATVMFQFGGPPSAVVEEQGGVIVPSGVGNAEATPARAVQDGGKKKRPAAE